MVNYNFGAFVATFKGNYDQAIGKELTDQEYDFVKVKTSMQAVYQSDRENKALAAVVLNVKYGSRTGVSSQGTYNVGTYKKQKVDAPYNRLLLMGDLLDPGFVFAIICTKAKDFDLLTQHGKGTIGIGSIVVIPETKRVTKYLRDLPIVESDNSFLPLKADKIQLPPALLHSSNNIEDATVYFSKNKVMIQLHTVKMETNTVSCSGRQCDRQRISTEAKGNSTCGCAYTERGPGMVIDGSLMLHVPAEFVPQEDMMQEPTVKDTHTLGEKGNECTAKVVENFRSWRFTNLVVRNADQVDSSRISRVVLRNKCKSVVDYVNANGGWTVVGWYKMGTTADASDLDKNANRTVSNFTRFHISLLRPSNFVLVKGTEYKDKQYDQSKDEADQVAPNGGQDNGPAAGSINDETDPGTDV